MSGVNWSFPFAFLWGFVLVAALAGWGTTLLRAGSANTKDFALGMAACLGTAIFIFLSGWLLLFGWFSRAFVLLFIILGVILFILGSVKRAKDSPRPPPMSPGLRVVAALAAPVVIFFYCDGPCDPSLNLFDDFPSYLTFPHIMFDTGSLIDPFGTRRLSALGGQSALHTLVFSVLPWQYGNLLDFGVGFLITIALVAEGVEGDSAWAFLARAILVCFAAMLPVVRVNITSEYTTLMLMFALLRALSSVARNEPSRARTALKVALLAGALATLRAQNLYAVGLILTASFVYFLWVNRSERFPTLRLGLGTAAALVLVLFSWMAVLQLSSGTFLYPLILGNQKTGFDMFNAKLSLGATLQFLFDFFIGTKFILLIVPVFFIRDRQTRNFAGMLGGCVLFISLAMAIKFSSSDAPNLYRYLGPMGLGFVLYSLTIAVNEWVAKFESAGWKIPSPAALICGFIVFLVAGNQLFVPDPRMRLLRLCQAFLTEGIIPYGYTDLRPDPEAARADYARGFSHLPVGTSVLIAVDYPFVVDYRNYRVFNIDQPGLASLPPGLPYFQGSEAVKTYLLQRGIQNIAYVPFDLSITLYGKESLSYLLWKNDRLTLLYAKYMTDLFKNVDKLAATNPVVYQSDYVHIISLVKPVAVGAHRE